MGTYITLGIKKFDVAWGKNNYFEPFNDLFQDNDYKYVDYYYAENVIERKLAYSSPIQKIKKRLDVLGYDIGSCKKIYDNLFKEYYEYRDDEIVLLTFEEFYNVFTKIDIGKINQNLYNDDYDLGEYAKIVVFGQLEIKKILPFNEIGIDYEWYENIPPRLILRILCDNPSVQEEEVTWYIADVIESEWVTEEELKPLVNQKDKIMIVTEGSSDTNIIKKSLQYIYGEISDLFDFVDMDKNYPFGSCGQLYNFCKGLTHIKIINNVLVIFDNDTSGIEMYNKCKNECAKMANIKFYHLPNYSEFEEFLCIGPCGETFENINGKAVSIENFLDLNYKNDTNPRIRWGGYNISMNQYQGALENKEQYSKMFFSNYKNKDYNLSKIKFLLDDIITFWIRERNNEFQNK